MKREDVLAEIDRRIDGCQRAIDASADFGSRIQDGMRQAGLREARDLIEQHIPANSVTLALPVYAPGDPKAGEPIRQGDPIVARAWDREASPVESFLLIDDELIPQVETFDEYCPISLVDPPPYYSTPEARDAAMEAAKDDN